MNNWFDGLVNKLIDLLTIFYYQKYYEWGLPVRRFAQVNIETNNICTRKCHFCLYGIKEEVPSNRMSESLYFKIIDDLVSMNYAGRVSLFNINEPLTDRRIFNFIQYASLMLPGSCHVLISNGDLLDREKLDLLFESGLDMLFINSYDEEALIKVGPLLEYAMPKYKDRIFHNNRTEFVNWESRAGNVEVYFTKSVEGYCDWPNQALYVKPDGRVLACCNDFEGVNLVGDLGKQSVAEVWYGEVFSRLRRRLNRGDRTVSPLCERCDHKPNLPYFRLNHLLPYKQGKTGFFKVTKPSPDKIELATKIKNEHLEKERSRLDKTRNRETMEVGLIRKVKSPGPAGETAVV